MECIYGEIHHHPLNSKDQDADHHHHHHSSASTNKRVLKISLLIIFVAMIFEFVYALITNSLALMSDSLHMLSHAIALGLSWFAIWVANSWKSEQKTFGYHRFETIVAFVNAILISVFGIIIIYEAIAKLINPEPIKIGSMLIVATIGLVVNGSTGLLMLKGDMENLNIKSAFIHMMSDLLSSIAIIIGGVIVYFTNLWWIDSILALVIALVIAKWSYSLIKDSINVLLESSPVRVELVQEIMLENPLIEGIHDLHISEITHRMYILTAHILIDKANMDKFPQIIKDLTHRLEGNFEIGHITIQPEWK